MWYGCFCLFVCIGGVVRLCMLMLDEIGIVACFYPWGAILWLLGVVGCLLNRRHLILMLMCVELMLLGACILFLGLAGTIDNLGGQVFTLFILTVAAAESSVGLAILIAHYRKRATIAVQALSLLKG